MTVFAGRAWKYGDNIDTDLLAPIGSYAGTTDAELAAGASQCLRALDPSFAKSVKAGDIFVAGANLGIGSSREAAPLFLKLLGIRVVLARNFARIFYRNCLNIGLPALACAEADSIKMGDRLRVDASAGTCDNLTQGRTLACEPLPDHLLAMLADGGLLPHLEKRLKRPA